MINSTSETTTAVLERNTQIALATITKLSGENRSELSAVLHAFGVTQEEVNSWGIHVPDMQIDDSKQRRVFPEELIQALMYADERIGQMSGVRGVKTRLRELFSLSASQIPTWRKTKEQESPDANNHQDPEGTTHATSNGTPVQSVDTPSSTETIAHADALKHLDALRQYITDLETPETTTSIPAISLSEKLEAMPPIDALNQINEMIDGLENERVAIVQLGDKAAIVRLMHAITVCCTIRQAICERASEADFTELQQEVDQEGIRDIANGLVDMATDLFDQPEIIAAGQSLLDALPPEAKKETTEPAEKRIEKVEPVAEAEVSEQTEPETPHEVVAPQTLLGTTVEAQVTKPTPEAKLATKKPPVIQLVTQQPKSAPKVRPPKFADTQEEEDSLSRQERQRREDFMNAMVRFGVAFTTYSEVLADAKRRFVEKAFRYGLRQLNTRLNKEELEACEEQVVAALNKTLETMSVIRPEDKTEIPQRLRDIAEQWVAAVAREICTEPERALGEELSPEQVNRLQVFQGRPFNIPGNSYEEVLDNVTEHFMGFLTWRARKQTNDEKNDAYYQLLDMAKQELRSLLDKFLPHEGKLTDYLNRNLDAVVPLLADQIV